MDLISMTQKVQADFYNSEHRLLLRRYRNLTLVYLCLSILKMCS